MCLACCKQERRAALRKFCLLQVHVTYVLQTTLLIIKADQQLAHPLLNDLDRLALVIAAYCHDVDHDGASS